MGVGATIGFDTSTALLSVATVRDGETLLESWVDADQGGRPRHGRALIGEIEEAVAAAGGWEEIGLIGVGVGPGTFTGLRIGGSTARALAQARRLPVVPVSSLAALAEPVEHRGRPLLSLIDAKRGELFAALWGADQSPLWGPDVLSPEGLVDRLERVDSPLAIGDGSLRFRDDLERAGTEVPADLDHVHRVSAAAVCRLAEAGDPLPLGEIEPNYLRRPDAELWREQQRERNDRDR